MSPVSIIHLNICSTRCVWSSSELFLVAFPLAWCSIVQDCQWNKIGIYFIHKDKFGIYFNRHKFLRYFQWMAEIRKLGGIWFLSLFEFFYNVFLVRSVDLHRIEPLQKKADSRRVWALSFIPVGASTSFEGFYMHSHSCSAVSVSSRLIIWGVKIALFWQNFNQTINKNSNKLRKGVWSKCFQIKWTSPLFYVELVSCIVNREGVLSLKGLN